jgi:hypothetical protein
MLLESFRWLATGLSIVFFGFGVVAAVKIFLSRYETEAAAAKQYAAAACLMLLGIGIKLFLRL